MKKAFLAIVMSVIMIVMASCGGNSHSKAFNESKKIIDKISESLKQAKTCDDLDVAAFGILGLLGVEGIDAISETEQQQYYFRKCIEELELIYHSQCYLRLL